MSRRGASLGASVMLALLCLAPAAGGLAHSYQHVWQAESMFAGEVGRTDKRVFGSVLEFVREGDTYRGVLRYHDALAISVEPGSVTSQEAVIELALDGVSQSGKVVGGTFTGTVTLTDRDVASVTEALAPPAGRGVTTVYAVTGHWGGTTVPDIVIGELIFETALPDVETGQVREVAWFNRSSFENPDMLGESQTFEAPVVDEFSAVPAPKPGEQPDSDAPKKAEPGRDQESGGGGASTARVRRAGFFAFIRQGASGGRDGALGWAPGDAVEAARALRDARPAGARSLPDNAVSIDIEYSGAYLDAKNRAAGLLGADGPSFEGSAELSASLNVMRASAPGIPALPPDVDAGRFWADFGQAVLRPHADVSGADRLIASLETVAAGLDPEGVLAVRASTMTALAVFRGPFGSVLDGVASCARQVAEAPLDSGVLSDAVLAAARDPRAPGSARIVTGFAREEPLDVTRDDERAMATLPATVMGGSNGPGIGFSNGGVTSVLDPPRWLGYRRADDAVYHLAESHEFALTGGSLLGWAYSDTRGVLVDANDVGILVVYTPYRR